MAVAPAASAADLPAKVYTKAPPAVAAFDPWDVAFGAAITNNYVFRGVSQSNREASVSGYFEPRFNVTKDLQLYVGAAGNSISFTNHAALRPAGNGMATTRSPRPRSSYARRHSAHRPK